jgi:hypothetical protein
MSIGLASPLSSFSESKTRPEAQSLASVSFMLLGFHNKDNAIYEFPSPMTFLL